MIGSTFTGRSKSSPRTASTWSATSAIAGGVGTSVTGSAAMSAGTQSRRIACSAVVGPVFTSTRGSGTRDREGDVGPSSPGVHATAMQSANESRRSVSPAHVSLAHVSPAPRDQQRARGGDDREPGQDRGRDQETRRLEEPRRGHAKR